MMNRAICKKHFKNCKELTIKIKEILEPGDNSTSVQQEPKAKVLLRPCQPEGGKWRRGSG